jgi:hypothetical protein
MSAPRLRLNPADPRFADAVLADIHRIGKSPAGQALFRRLLDVGTSVTIDKPQPPTSPPNAWTRLADPDRQGGEAPERQRGDAPDRQGGDAVIAYDPADWPEPAALGVLPSDAVLFGCLLDALAMATGAAATSRSSESGVPAEMEAYLRQRTARTPSSARPKP